VRPGAVTVAGVDSVIASPVELPLKSAREGGTSFRPTVRQTRNAGPRPLTLTTCAERARRPPDAATVNEIQPGAQEPEPSGTWLALLVTGLALRRPLGQDVPAVARGSPSPSRLSRHSSSYFLPLTRCTRPDHASRLSLQRAGKHKPSAPHQARLRPGVLLVLVVMSWGLVMATYLGSAAQSSSTAGSSRTPVASSAVLLAEPYSFLPTPQ